jgi:hypothetical protein
VACAGSSDLTKGTRPSGDYLTTEGRSQVLDECSPDDGACGAVFGSGALLEGNAELVGKDCGNLRHGSAYRTARLPSQRELRTRQKNAAGEIP